jgi:hypothetical protein
VTGGATNISGMNFDPSYPVKFAGVSSTNNANWYRWYSGKLADLAIFSVALSSNQIASLTNATVASAFPTGITSSNTVSISVLTPATISITATNQVYDGVGKVVTAAPSPGGAVPLSVTYSNGSYGPSTNGPTNAGSYTVVATTLNTNYTGSSTATLTVAPATPVISLSGTNWPYNGSGRSVTAATVPTGIPVNITYNGSSSAPSNVGSYAVFANNGATANWNDASATGTLTIYDPVASWRQGVYGTASNVGVAADTAKAASGMNNLQSYTFGVDPTKPMSGPLLSIVRSNTGVITLSFVARSSGSGSGYGGLTRYYNLEGTTNATNGNWVPLSGYSNIPGADQTVTLKTNSSGGPKWFYRLKAWLQ